MTPFTIVLVLLLVYWTLNFDSSKQRFRFLQPVQTVLCHCIDCITWYILRRRPVYMLSFHLFTPPIEWQVSTTRFQTIASSYFKLRHSSVDFCMRLLDKSGIGETSAFPPGITSSQPNIGISSARSEALIVLTSLCNHVFQQHRWLKAVDVDILIVNCSLFVPTPSLCAMIINYYKMRTDIESYNLGGMGCSASNISIHLASQLLHTRRNCTALIISTENITQNIYLGSEKSMLISNALFRCGGAAIVMSNRDSDRLRHRARYQLYYTLRTTLASDNEAYQCVYQDEDSEGFRGVRLDKCLMNVASRALQSHVRSLAPVILSWIELLKCVVNIILRSFEKLIRRMFGQHISSKSHSSMSGESPGKTQLWIREYTPHFSSSISHFCIHAGGAAVLRAIQQGLQLNDKYMQASWSVLSKYGNTSSSSIWYELKEVEGEKDQNVKRGQLVWMLSFGSGFKCNSSVWKRIK